MKTLSLHLSELFWILLKLENFIGFYSCTWIIWLKIGMNLFIQISKLLHGSTHIWKITHHWDWELIPFQRVIRTIFRRIFPHSFQWNAGIFFPLFGLWLGGRSPTEPKIFPQTCEQPVTVSFFSAPAVSGSDGSVASSGKWASPVQWLVLWYSVRSDSSPLCL